MRYDWEGLFRKWHQYLVEGPDYTFVLSGSTVDSAWPGRPGATDAELQEAERRLAIKFPPSYREFLAFSNGWPDMMPFIPHLWSTHEVDWLNTRHQDWIDVYSQDPVDDEPDPLTRQMLVEHRRWIEEGRQTYGPEQCTCDFSVRHFARALQIGEIYYDIIWLLNPCIVDAGEWQAWHFADSLAGARRHPSAWDLMHARYDEFGAQRAAFLNGQSIQ